METKQFLGLVVAGLVLILLAVVVVKFVPNKAPSITNFEECVAAGHAVMESYPRQCNANGQNFVEDITQTQPTSNETDGMQFNGCAVAGCSGQLCVSAAEAENMMTTCEYRPEYACYKEASCEPQADDTCGWTMTDELKQCLANPPSSDTNLQQI